MGELKACPFCGGRATFKATKSTFSMGGFMNRSHYSYVQCTVCSATSPVKYTMEDAREAWNRRAKNAAI